VSFRIKVVNIRLIIAKDYQKVVNPKVLPRDFEHPMVKTSGKVGNTLSATSRKQEQEPPGRGLGVEEFRFECNRCL